MNEPVPPPSDESWLIEALAPRPLAWITTLSSAGEVNLAPFSAMTIIANSPPTLLLAIERTEEGRMKRTAQNIHDQGEFVINLPAREQLVRLMRSSDPTVPPSKRAKAGAVRFAASSTIGPPLIVGCNAALECRLARHDRAGGFPQPDLFWGEVIKSHMRDVDHSGRPRPFVGALGYEWFVSEEGLQRIDQPYLHLGRG